MEWLIALAAVGACVWFASRVLGTGVQEVDRCRACGAPVTLADESVELVKHGVGTRLWANCTACGASTDLTMGLDDESVWLR